MALAVAILSTLTACSPPQEAELTIPIHIVGLSERLIMAPPVPKGITVTVAGPKGQLEKLRNQGLRYTLDLSKAAPGLLNFPVDQRQLAVGQGAVVLRVDPQNLAVRIEEQLQKKVPVEVKTDGKPGANFHIEQIRIEPEVVLLKGPQSLLADVKKVVSKPVAVEGLTESIKKEVALDLPEGVELDKASAPIVVDIVIAQRIATRTFEHVPVGLRNNSWNAAVTPATVNLEVKGPVATLESLATDGKIEVSVDLKDLPAGVYVRRAVISLPVGVTLLSAKPEVFTVTDLQAARRAQTSASPEAASSSPANPKP